MKLSAFLCSYSGLYARGASTEEVIRAAAEAGFGAVEPFPAADLNTVDAARAAGECAHALGLEVCCFSDNFELLRDPDAMQRARRHIDLAAAMGSPYYHHTIYPPLSLRRARECSRREALDAAVPRLRELCAYAADRGVTCLYENQGLYFNGVEGMRMLVDRMDGAPYGLVADVGNIFFVDERPEDFIGAFADRIVHVHLKDYLWKPGSELCPGRGWYLTRGGNYLRDTIPGHGAVRFPAVLRVLDAMGYQGWHSLEYAAMEDAGFGIGMALDYLRACGRAVAEHRPQEPRFEGVSPVFE